MTRVWPAAACLLLLALLLVLLLLARVLFLQPLYPLLYQLLYQLLYPLLLLLLPLPLLSESWGSWCCNRKVERCHHEQRCGGPKLRDQAQELCSFYYCY
jgi:membrane protease YdiL (CAAX protease family)